MHQNQRQDINDNNSFGSFPLSDQARYIRRPSLDSAPRNLQTDRSSISNMRPAQFVSQSSDRPAGQSSSSFNRSRPTQDESNILLSATAPFMPLTAQARPSASMARQLGALSVNEPQTDAMFDIYFKHYHPFLPFLDHTRSPDQYFEKSPLLFWSIMAVASRQYEEDVTLLHLISAPLTQLVWQTVSDLPNSLYTVQALLLLCTWPFPAWSLWQEPTPIWSAMATSIVQLLGLPHLDTAGEFKRVKSAPEWASQEQRLQTWAACAIVCQNTITSFGSLPTSLHGLTTAQGLEEEYTQRLPEELKAQMLLSAFCNKVGRVFFNGSSESSRDPLSSSQGQLLQQLDLELSILKHRLGTVSDINKLLLLSAELLLHVHFFYIRSLAPEKKPGILKAYVLADTLISQSISAHQKFAFYAHLTSHFFRTLFTAACVLWKVLNSCYCLDVDCEAGKASFNRAICALRKCLVENNDTAGRQSEILVQLWNSRENNHDKRGLEPTVQYRARHSASLAYDCLFYWRDQVGGQITTGLHTSATIPVDGVRDDFTSASTGSTVTVDDVLMNNSDIFGPDNGFVEAWDFGDPSLLLS